MTAQPAPAFTYKALTCQVAVQFGTRTKTLPAILSKNTRPGEKPWRFTVFQFDAQGSLHQHAHLQLEAFEPNLAQLGSQVENWLQQITGFPDAVRLQNEQLS